MTSWWTRFKLRPALGAATAAVSATVLAGIAVLVVHLSFRLTNPPGYAHPGPTTDLKPTGAGVDPQQELGIEFEEVSFPTSGQETLRGWLVRGKDDARVGVVTAHGRGADRRDFLRHVPVFHQLELPTLLFDYREHGTSDGAQRGMSMGFREAQDISAAVRYMKETLGLERVVVVGVSLGASSAILAAAQDGAIDAVVAESPFASIDGFLYDEVERVVEQRPLFRYVPRPQWWPHLIVQFTAWRLGVDGLQAPVDVVDQIAPRPLLLMHGTGDISVDQMHSERLYARAGAPKELWLAEGAGHTQVYDRYPDEYRARISAFLRSVASQSMAMPVTPSSHPG
jgi:alpha-beta hydrolase superfamily lysophospholipase